MAARRTAPQLFKATGVKRGGGYDPYEANARFGSPATKTSKWHTHMDIRSPIDGRWAPAHYGGDQVKSMSQFISELDLGHPVIEPLFHPKLTHEQRMTRLYRRALIELRSQLKKFHGYEGLFSFYARQVRDEFEKNRHVDRGSAEWQFLRATNYIDNKKEWVIMGQEWMPGRTYHGRYAQPGHPDTWPVFPHGFDPDEATKLMNPFARYGVPYMGRLGYTYSPTIHACEVFVTPHNAPGRKFLKNVGRAVLLYVVACVLLWMIIGQNTLSINHDPARERQTGSHAGAYRNLPTAYDASGGYTDGDYVDNSFYVGK